MDADSWVLIALLWWVIVIPISVYLTIVYENSGFVALSIFIGIVFGTKASEEVEMEHYLVKRKE